MNILSHILGSILRGSAQSALTSYLAQSPLGAWLLCLGSLFMLFMNGMNLTSYLSDSMLLAYLLAGVALLAVALLMMRGHARIQRIMLILAAAALLGGMVTGYFVNADLYDYAMARFEEGKYEVARDRFETLNGFRDSEDKIVECDERLAEIELQERYTKAMERLADSPEGAYSAMRALAEDGYAPAIEALATPEFQAAREAYYGVGNMIFFGTYLKPVEHSGSGRLDWRIVARDGDRALLVSYEVVDDHPYHDTEETVTWADSSIRRWLNSEFLDIAFTPEEQALIQLTWVEDGGGEGVPSQDRIFLLSYDEACRYLTGSDGLKGRPTEYMRTLTYYNRFCPWMLRPVEADITTVPGIDSEGELTTLHPRYDPSGVRPAMWITLDPAFF